MWVNVYEGDKAGVSREIIISSKPGVLGGMCDGDGYSVTQQ